MSSDYDYYCITCGISSWGNGESHYDPKELEELWRVRKSLIELYQAGIPMRLHDGICYNGYARFFVSHADHQCQVQDRCGWTRMLSNETKEEPTEPVNLRQLVSADGLKSGFVQCEPGVPRTVNTVLAQKMGVFSGELPPSMPNNSRRYEYRKSVPAVVRIYEEQS